MRLTNLTRGNEIGANSYLLEFGEDATVLLDAGMHPREEGIPATPNLPFLDNKEVDSIFVSHAHHDHIGAMPVAMRYAPQAKVFMSEPTYHLAEPLLHNSIEVMFKQRDERGITEYPLYTHKEIDQLSQIWQPCHLGVTWSLEGQAKPKKEPVTFEFYDAGHILGAVGIEFNHRGQRIFYTGDVNFRDQRLMAGAKFPDAGIDTLITETTRGNQSAPAGFTRDGEVDRLVRSINETFANDGAVMIPVFAMGKTQEILAELFLQQKKGNLPKCPIYIGGLGRSFTAIYDKLARRSSRKHQDLDLMRDVRPEVMDGKKVQDFKPRKGEIYLISSGMMTEKTLSNTLGKKFLAQERHSIFFVGYCDPTSPAGRLLATPRGEQVQLDEKEDGQPALCRVDKFDFTAHAQREDLLAHILKVDPRVCVLVHGDQPALDWFQAQLREQRPNMKLVVPPPLETLEI